jgi:hypothetical protein
LGKLNGLSQERGLLVMGRYSTRARRCAADEVDGALQLVRLHAMVREHRQVLVHAVASALADPVRGLAVQPAALCPR